MTLTCSYGGRDTGAVWWEQSRSVTVCHWDETRINAAFKGRARALGEQPGSCSLCVMRLCPEDQGSYQVWIELMMDGNVEQYELGTVRLHVAGQQIPCPPLAWAVTRGQPQSCLRPQNSALPGEWIHR